MPNKYKYVICKDCGLITLHKAYLMCNRCSKRKFYYENRIKILEKQKEYKKENREREIRRSRRYHLENKEKERKRRKRYRLNNPHIDREHNQRRRAWKKGAIVEKFSNLDIYKRDKWKCGICGGKVNKHLKYPHPLSPSLDHIVPLSRGGSHIPENVQLAHLRCNLSKGSKTGFTKLLTQDGKAGKMGVVKQNEGEISE